VKSEADKRLSDYLATKPSQRDVVIAMEDYVRELKTMGTEGLKELGVDIAERESRIETLRKDIGMEE
jgi:hypothetical protein